MDLDVITIVWNDQVAVNSPGRSTVFFICDDCREAYLSPRYYTFDRESCIGSGTGLHGCTENICPDCAGPWLIPVEENDPRRPTS